MKHFDVVGQIAVDRIFKEGSRSEVNFGNEDSAKEPRLGGKAFNIAVALAKLGRKVRLISAIGKDKYGSDARKVLDDYGVDTSMLLVSTYGQGTVYTTPEILLTEGQHEERIVKLRGINDLSSFYSQAMRRCYSDTEISTQNAGPQASVLIFTLEYEDKVLKDLSDLIRRYNRLTNRTGIVIGNPAPRRQTSPSYYIFELLRQANGIVPNQFEERFLLGNKDLPDPTKRLIEVYGVQWCITTLGSRGWRWAQSNEQGDISLCTDSIPTSKVHNKVGASDVFTAIIAIFAAEGQLSRDSNIVAGVAASLAISKDGGAERFPTASEIIEKLEKVSKLSDASFRNVQNILFKSC